MGVSAGLRFRVLARDLFTCRYCGAHPPDVVLEIDHLIPRSAGGRDTLMNLVAACYSCNRGKRALVMEPEVVAFIAPPAEFPIRQVISAHRSIPRPPSSVVALPLGLGARGPYVGDDQPARRWRCSQCGMECSLEGDVCSCDKPRYTCSDCGERMDEAHGYEDGYCEECYYEYQREVNCAECGYDERAGDSEFCEACAQALAL